MIYVGSQKNGHTFVGGIVYEYASGHLKHAPSSLAIGTVDIIKRTAYGSAALNTGIIDDWHVRALTAKQLYTRHIEERRA